MVVDNNNGKWIASDQGLFYIDRYNKKIEKIEPFVSTNALAFDAGSFEMWVAGSKKDGSLGLFRGFEGKFAEVSLPDEIRDSFINQLYYDPSGRVWVCSSVLALYDGGKWLIFDEKLGLKSSSIACIHIDKDRNIWVGTDGSGLFVSYANPELAKKREEVKVFEQREVPKNQTVLEAALSEGIDLSKDYPIKIQFDEDKDIVKPDYEKDLNVIAEILFRNPDLNVEIKGHTERSNNLLYIQKLSERRANAVKNYLVGKKSIAASRVVAVGYGAKYPLSMDPRNTAANRRVEVRFFRK
jgi:outer membrane protein OmpA-like peptidoglycan-associated protein